MRALIMARSRREKFMLTAFLITIVAIWALGFVDRATGVSRQFQSTEALLRDQQVILDDAEWIQSRMQAGIENLDPSRILSGSLLISELDSIARGHQLSHSIDSPRSEEGEVFFFHTVTINVQRAGLGALVDFAEEIQDRAPYMGLEEVSLIADRNNPTRLDARFRISSVELAP